MPTILVLHGPNMNLLGSREPDVYGTNSLEEINQALKIQAEKSGFGLESFQSNAEHELIQKIHASSVQSVEFIIINPAAFTHSSVALRDALLAVQIPFIEVHMSNVFKRESFRSNSYFADVAEGVIVGLGPFGYSLALKAAIRLLKIKTGGLS